MNLIKHNSHCAANQIRYKRLLLHRVCHVSTGAQHGETKHWFSRGCETRGVQLVTICNLTTRGHQVLHIGALSTCSCNSVLVILDFMNENKNMQISLSVFVYQFVKINKSRKLFVC